MKPLMLMSILMMALSLSACGPQPTLSASASPAPAPPKVNSATEELSISLHRSGGFAGLNETFVIKADGSVVVGLATRQSNGGAAAAAQLAGQLAASGVFDVATDKYMPANPCCDRYTYDLTLVKDGKAYNYVTMDASETAPPALFKAIGLIQQYIATAH